MELDYLLQFFKSFMSVKIILVNIAQCAPLLLNGTPRTYSDVTNADGKKLKHEQLFFLSFVTGCVFHLVKAKLVQSGFFSLILWCWSIQREC